jgi:hypothetical protein
MSNPETTKPFQARQGDVLIVAAAMPAELVPIDPKASPRGFVLAEGEATGHAHSIAWPMVGRAGADQAGTLCFEVGEGAELVHQEHSAIPLPAQSYRALRQKEYSPEEVRNVQD